MTGYHTAWNVAGKRPHSFFEAVGIIIIENPTKTNSIQSGGRVFETYIII